MFKNWYFGHFLSVVVAYRADVFLATNIITFHWSKFKTVQYISCQIFSVLLLYFINNRYYNLFPRRSSKKRELSDQSNNGDDWKTRKEGRFEDLNVSNSSGPGDVFASILKASECVEVLLNCMKNVKSQIK